VAAVEAQLGAATAATLAEIDLSQLKQGAIVKAVSSPTGETITIAVMSLEGAAANGGKLEIPISSGEGGFEPKVEMPVSVLRAASASGDPVAMGASVMGASSRQALAQALGDSSPEISGAPLTLSMFDLNSKPISIQHLEEPIIIKVSNNASKDTQCMFWNASLGDWSGEGVRKLTGNNSDLMCSTTHLSIFAGIAKKIGQTFECSNAASLFSNDAMNNISNGEWASSGPSIAVWSVVSAFVVFMVFAALLDHRDSNRFKIVAHLRGSSGRTRFDSLRQSVAQSRGTASLAEPAESSLVSWCKLIASTALELVLMLLEAVVGRFKAMLQALLKAPQAPRIVVETALNEAQSFQLGVDSASVSTIRKFDDGLNLSDEAQTIVTSHKVYHLSKGVAEKKDLENTGDNALFSFLERSSAYRFFCLCAALNPVVAMTSFSLFDTHMTRACLFCVRVAGAAASNAVFYDMSALPKDMTQDLQETCAAEDSYGWVGNLVVGVVSTALSDGVMFFLVGIRGMQYPELALLDGAEIPLRKMEHRIMAAQVRGVIFWLILISYSGTCFYVVLAFNSSVSEKDQEEWFLACLWTLLELLILECVVGALIMTTLCGFVFCCSSNIKRSVTQSRAFSGRFSTLRSTVAGRLSMMGVLPTDQTSGAVPAEPASEFSPAGSKTSVFRLSVGSRSSHSLSSVSEDPDADNQSSQQAQVKRDMRKTLPLDDVVVTDV